MSDQPTDIITALASHGVELKPGDKDAWQTAAETGVFPYVMLCRNATAFAYTVNMMNVPVKVEYGGNKKNRDKVVWMAPWNADDAKARGIEPGRSTTSITMLLTYGSQLSDDQSYWMEGIGRIKGGGNNAHKQRPVKLMVMSEATYQQATSLVAGPL